MKFARPQGNNKHAERQAMRVERGHGSAKQTQRQAMRVERGFGGGKHAQRVYARSGNRDGRFGGGRDARFGGERDARFGGERDARFGGERQYADRDYRDANDGRRYDTNYDGRGYDYRSLAGLTNGCPPGLAMKNDGCLPPGQAKRMIGAVLPAGLASQALSGPYSQWYRDNDQYYYRDDGDYIYRVNRNGGLVDALFPYQDQSYSYYPVGASYPTDYDYYNVPYQYQSYYPDGNDYSYRYGDGAIYQVNRSNNTIDSIVALLAGDLGVGQQLPSDYGVYNVPMAYRDRYYDTPDALYRYNDGYIYQADPKTQLITAVIDALV